MGKKEWKKKKSKGVKVAGGVVQGYFCPGVSPPLVGYPLDIDYF